MSSETSDTPRDDPPPGSGLARTAALWRELANARERAAVALSGNSRRTRLTDLLAVRIALINLIGLAVFGMLIIAFGGGGTGLIDERTRALDVHSRIIAGAIVEGAVSGPAGGRAEINVEDATRILRRLVLPTGYRARLYDTDGNQIADSRTLDLSSTVEVRVIDPPSGWEKFWADVAYGYDWIMGVIPRGAEHYTEGPNVRYEEVEAALSGSQDPNEVRNVRIGEEGDIIISIATPVQRYRAYLGALLLSAEGDEIQAAMRQERNVLGRMFLLAVIANLLISVGYAMNIVSPIRRLAREADRVRRAGTAGSGADIPQLPDWPNRRDEIGELGRSLKDMTSALYGRIDAIESFAADVSHEIKNPLTSLRSAVETLDYAKDDAAKARLLSVIRHDVDRLDRLITDISDASRLDAELTREETEFVSIPTLLQGLTQIYQDSAHERNIQVVTEILTGALPESALRVRGIESRLGQVVQNLLSNAISFSPDNSMVRLTAKLDRDNEGRPLARIEVEDAGPGIPEESIERIFERFYTERPGEDNFGNNSGLGLSISRQIVTAHGGFIWAENRKDMEGEVIGARFIVALPAAIYP